MNKVTQFQRWCKAIKKDRKSKIYIGLDVHKRTFHMAIWYNDKIVVTLSLSSDYSDLIRTLQKIPRRIEKIVYEAGPTGFGLAHTLKGAGYSVAVIAPSSLLQPRGQHSKSDRLDCRALAKQMATSTDLKEVAIPTLQEEEDRQIYRLRSHLVKKRKRIKQQIKSFLLQHSIPEPPGLERWTKASVYELRCMELPKGLKFTLLVLLSEMEDFDERILDAEDYLMTFFEKAPYQETLKILRSHPVVGPITALAFCMEIHQPDRFTEGKSIAKYIGLAPRIDQTGETIRRGKIMKVGKNGLRSILIEASWRWIGCDEQARNLYDRLRKNSGNGNKAIVGVARHLAIILWRMVLDKTEYKHIM